MNNKTEFFKDLYNAELERRENISSALVIPIGVLTLLGSGLIYLMQNYKLFADVESSLIGIFLIIATSLFCFSIYLLIRSYFGYTYKFLPDSKSLQQYWNKLGEYYREQKRDEQTADIEFELYIENSYVEATTDNAWNNDSKSEFLHRANRAMIWCLGIIIVCSIPILLSKNENVQKVRIVNEKLLIQQNEDNMAKEQKPTSVNQTPKPVSPKPEPPPLRQIREGVQPPKPKK